MTDEVTTEDAGAAAGDAPATPPVTDSTTDAGKPGGEETPAVALGAETDDKPADQASASGDGKPAGDEPNATVPPETYADFELPEGMEINAEYLEQMTPVFKDLGLTQEAAQKLVSAHAKQVQAGEEARASAFNQLTQDWLTATKADKEIGGDKFEESLQHARRALGEFGTPALNELFRNYGIGNHPEVVRAFTRIGKLMKEDQPGQLGNGAEPPKSRVDLLYGNPEAR